MGVFMIIDLPKYIEIRESFFNVKSEEVDFCIYTNCIKHELKDELNKVQDKLKNNYKIWISISDTSIEITSKNSIRKMFEDFNLKLDIDQIKETKKFQEINLKSATSQLENAKEHLNMRIKSLECFKKLTEDIPWEFL